MVTRQEKQIMIGLGIILLLIGVVLSLYPRVVIYHEPFTGMDIELYRDYPYQGIGIALVLIGAGFTGVGIFVRPTREVFAPPAQAPPP